MKLISVFKLAPVVWLAACVAFPDSTRVTQAPTSSVLPSPATTLQPATLASPQTETPVSTNRAPSSSPGLTATSSRTTTPNATDVPVSGETLFIDHRAVDLFDQIPDSALPMAVQIRYMLRHASVGVNISFGLDCLWGNFTDRRPTACGDYHDLKYDRSHWSFQPRGNPGWIAKVDDFVNETNRQINDFDVFSFAVDYADGLDGMTYPVISDPENFQKDYVDKLEALEAAHPDKTFVWWTMSVARLGFANSQKFNDMLREYARTHHKILFDISDIESHDPNGVKSTDENGHEVLYQGYTNEEKAGHLNQAGRERVARAFWYLMARLGGWDGSMG